MRISMQVSTEDARLIMTVAAESEQDRQLLAILTHRRAPDELDCDPVGSDDGLPQEACFYWKPRERGT